MARMLFAMALAGALLVGGPSARATEAACRAPLQPAYEINLFLGRAKASGAIVPERAVARFLDEVVSPRFPDGLTVLDAYGEFRAPSGAFFREPAKLVLLLVPDAAAVEGKVQAIIRAYKRRFSQNAVLRTEQKLCVDLG